MATKTYLPAVQRRIIVRPNPVYGIINYDLDNAYPQRILEIVRQSPTGKRCWGEWKKYLSGNGFSEPKLGDVVINQAKNISLAMILNSVAEDYAMFPGYGIHVNYNANYKITSVSHVKYEDIRQGDTDSEKYRGKYIIYKDWGRKTWRSIYSAKFDVLHPFNPDPQAIKAQVIEAGGWENYKGQLFYLTPVVDDYELCEFDAAIEDHETEAGIKIFNNRQVKTGFLPSAMLFMPSRREEADNEGLIDDGMAGYSKASQPSLLEQNLATFQGVEESQKIIVVEYDGDAENKPELNQYQIQNNDKLFEVTSSNVEGNIIKSWVVPKELVTKDTKNGLSNGGEKNAAIIEFNDTTSRKRLKISEVFEMIFSYFVTPVNPSNNWEISEVTTQGAGEKVIQAGPEVRELIESKVLKAERKIKMLVYMYGFKQSEAVDMVPTDEEMQAITDTQAAADNLKRPDDNIETKTEQEAA